MRVFVAAGAIAVAVLLGGCGGSVSEPAGVEAKSETTDGMTFSQASGLRVSDIKVGTGAFPRAGQTCVVHYTGWIYQSGRRARSSTAPSTAGSRSSSRSGRAWSSEGGTRVFPP